MVERAEVGGDLLVRLAVYIGVYHIPLIFAEDPPHRFHEVVGLILAGDNLLGISNCVCSENIKNAATRTLMDRPVQTASPSLSRIYLSS